MLDASLPPPHFFERNEDGSLKVIIQGLGVDKEIFAFVPLEDDSDEEDEGEYFEGNEDGGFWQERLTWGYVTVMLPFQLN